MIECNFEYKIEVSTEEQFTAAIRKLDSCGYKVNPYNTNFYTRRQENNGKSDCRVGLFYDAGEFPFVSWDDIEGDDREYFDKHPATEISFQEFIGEQQLKNIIFEVE